MLWGTARSAFCGRHFVTIQQWTTDRINIANAGQAIHEDIHHNPLIHESAKGLSKLCREDILKGVLQEKPTAKIVQDIRTAVVRALQHEHKLESEEATLAAMHNKEISIPPDYFISERDVENVRRPVDSQNWRFTSNAAQNVRYLTQLEPENVVYYQEQQGAAKSFILCVMTPWQEEMLLKYGHGGALLFDDTFETNNQKVLSQAGPVIVCPTSCVMIHMSETGSEMDLSL
jgi:hypothetical protein